MRRAIYILAIFILSLLFIAGCSKDDDLAGSNSNQTKECVACKGTGKCNLCDGDGILAKQKCGYCNGNGKCYICKGTGRVTIKK